VASERGDALIKNYLGEWLTIKKRGFVPIEKK